jgi:hypothetical protein
MRTFLRSSEFTVISVQQVKDMVSNFKVPLGLTEKMRWCEKTMAAPLITFLTATGDN